MAENAPDTSEVRVLDVDRSLVTFKPKGKHTATVIFLHGLGGQPSDLIAGVAGLRKHLNANGHTKGIKFILPAAPRMQLSSGGNMRPSWFDLYSFDIENRAEDEEGLLRCASWLSALIDKEVKECKIDYDRIIIGGISQGGAVICRTLLNTERMLGGAFLLSSYVPLRRKVPEIFWGHGVEDAQVKFPFSLQSAEQLAKDLEIGFVRHTAPLTLDELDLEDGIGVKLRFCSYSPLGHWFSDREIEDLAVWMTDTLPPVKPPQGARKTVWREMWNKALGTQ